MYTPQVYFHSRARQSTNDYGKIVSHSYRIRTGLSIKPYLPMYFQVRAAYQKTEIPMMSPDDASKSFKPGHFDPIDYRILQFVLWYNYKAIRKEAVKHPGALGYWEPSYPSSWCINREDDGYLADVVMHIRDTTGVPTEIIPILRVTDPIRAIANTIHTIWDTPSAL